MNGEAIVEGALDADRLCLGPHWVYDQEEIARRIPRADVPHDPISQYHPGKKAGDQTHYGDQLALLARHLREAGAFDLHAWAAVWRAFWEDPATISYRDKATRETLANLQSGLAPGKAGSGSSDLAGASGIAALFLLRWPDEMALLQACRELAAFTHNQPQVVAASEFFARVILATGGGASVPDAVDQAGGALQDERLRAWLEAGRKSAVSEEPDADALRRHGLSCDVDGGFAGVCHLLARYPDRLETALIANAMAGGDSAARGIPIGAIRGAAISKSLEGAV
jgi:ADP-ribosylglycohydrolase